MWANFPQYNWREPASLSDHFCLSVLSYQLNRLVEEGQMDRSYIHTYIDFSIYLQKKHVIFTYIFILQLQDFEI